MRPLRAFFSRIAGSFAPARRDRELADELASHLQMHIDDNVRAGMTADEARRHALIKLGGVDQVKEQYRDRRGLPWLAMAGQERGEVEVVAVARPEDAEPAPARVVEQPRDPAPMAREGLPLILARGVELGLLPFGSIHGPRFLPRSPGSGPPD